jgi:hypothetical protein
MGQCCKKMPKIINMKSVRECFKNIRPAQPPEGPGRPPPAAEGPGGPPPLPPATEISEVEESGDNDAADVETVEDIDGQNGATSEQLRHRPGGKTCKGMSLPTTAN